MTKPRARDLGIPFVGQPGPYNAITDVVGVTVGHTTLIEGSGPLVVGQGPVRTPEHVFNALDGAAGGPVREGNVGGGTGMITFGFKGGIGSGSRLVTIGEETHTVGVLVQANFGSRPFLTIAGVPVGHEIEGMQPGSSPETGSIIVIVATDAPLLPHQLKRLAARVPAGLSKVGGHGANSSGDIFLAFSTANPGAFNRQASTQLTMLPNDSMSALFNAVVFAVEEAVVNALVAAETMTGINGHTVYALPHRRVQDVLEKYGRLLSK